MKNIMALRLNVSCFALRIVLAMSIGCGYESSIDNISQYPQQPGPAQQEVDSGVQEGKDAQSDKHDQEDSGVSGDGNNAEAGQSAGKAEPQNKKPAVGSGSWPLFRGNAQSQGVATSKLPSKLEVLWQHDIPKGAFEGTPIIVGTKQKPVVYIGDADGSLLAMALKTGKVLWEFKSEIGFTTAPAYRDGLIYIGDLDGKFFCVDESGKKVWEFAAEDSIDSSANFYKNMVLFGSRDAKLYALDAKSGELIWQLDTSDQVRCSISVVGGRAFVAGCDGALHIVQLDEGKELTSIAIDSPTGVTPAALGDNIFVGTEQSGYYGIDWKLAQRKWNFNDKEGPISSRSSPSVVAGHVVFGARNRKVYSVDPDTGKQNWATELKANIDSSPVIVGQRVFIGSTDGRFYELELKTGKILWQKQFNGGFVSSPAVGFGKLVVATDRGVVYCLGNDK